MTRLAAVPDAPRRAVAYIRVSDEGGRGDEMMSPQIQLAAIKDHCQRRGYVIVKVLEDIDLTGRFWKRRQVEQAVAMIEAGEADCIVVWKMSRVSRNRLDWAVAVDRVEGAGGALESATEPVDATTSTGRFTRGILAELAAFESERIGEGWREVHRQLHEQGLPVNGKLPFGWLPGRPPVHDPATAPVVRELYDRWLAGESFTALARWLQPRYPTRTGTPWHPTVVRCLMDNPMHAGMVRYKGQVRQGAHLPIISAETWERYVAARGDARRAGRRATSGYLLSGLVRCGHCGRAMTGHPGGGHPLYECSHARATRGHAYQSVSARWLEDAVMGYLAAVADRIDQVQPDPGPARDDRLILESRVTDLDRRLATLTQHLVSGLVPERAYRDARDQIQADRAVLVAELAQLKGAAALAVSAPEARSLLAEWSTFDLQRKRAMLRRLVVRVTVWPGPNRQVEVTPQLEESS